MKILISAKNVCQNYTSALEAMGVKVEGGYLVKGDPNDYDGLLLCGGGDIHPRYYGEEIDGSVRIDTDRDEHELQLADDFIKAGKPVMGICRGCQLLNVYFGGSLIQHLETTDIHKGETDLVHVVCADTDSFLCELYGKEFPINSIHHQAVGRLGEGLKIILRSKEDGVVEAFEHESLPVFALQFHPERMCFDKKRDDAVDGKGIFDYFIKMCAEAKK